MCALVTGVQTCALPISTSKDAFIDEGAAPGGQPLAIERARTKPERPDGVINDRDPLGEYPFAQRIQEEAGFAGNGCARHAADQMSDQAGADSGIEDDGHLPAFDLDRSEARNGALDRERTRLNSSH